MSGYELRCYDQLDPDSDLGRAWEALAMDAPASGFMQSLHWAAFKRELGQRVLHLVLFDADRPAGGMLGYAAPRRHVLGVIAAPDGPILPWHEPKQAREGLRLLLRAVEQHAPAIGAQSLQIEPRLVAPRPPLLRNFRRAPVDLLPTETLYLDLRPGEDALLAAMHPKGRYNIRLAARRGVVVHESVDPVDVRRLYPLLRAAGERDDFWVEPARFFAALAERLCPAGLARMLFAERDGDTLAAMLLITYGRRATYLYGAVANHDRHLMAGYALQWAAIRRARALGCAVYDFYGYEPTGDPDHLYANFSRFKRQFGGAPVRFIGAQSYMFLDQLASAVIRAAHEIERPTTGR